MLDLLLTALALAAPLALLWWPWSRLAWGLAGVLALQAAAAWVSGCLTSTWQCHTFCGWLYPACVDLADDNDAAPFGIALQLLVGWALTLAALVARGALRWWRRRRAS